METIAATKQADRDSIRVTRRLAAPPERAFEAWVNPALLCRWLAPIAEADARAGGCYRLEVSKPEGSHVVAGVYREFAPADRLVMTWVYEGPMAPEGKMEALLTVEFRKDGAGAEISLHHEHLTAPRYFETIRQGAWTKALDELEALLANPSPK
ncbi:MAG: SRPBCC domain-containing protein [Acidobacteriota bacterium]|nr:SRPBCC domain-containing protein [Acidobacteriota bacterium]